MAVGGGAMKELKEIDPVSLGKIAAIISAIAGFIQGLFFAAFAGMMGSFGGMMGGGMMGSFRYGSYGVASIIIFPIIGAIWGFIVAVIFAVVYDIVAKRFGGVKYEAA